MLYLLSGIGLALFVVAVAALLALVRSGQLDDLDTPAARMLGDEPSPLPGPGRPASTAQPPPTELP
jgi:cbb3-type cytochrome oxidase maturation protein